jgi:hypothetical protein
LISSIAEPIENKVKVKVEVQKKDPEMSLGLDISPLTPALSPDAGERGG